MSKRGENIYKRKDGRWEGRFRRKVGDGYIYVYGHTYKETKERLAVAKQKELDTSSSQEILTVEQCLKLWLEEKQKQGLKQSTIANYRILINRHLLPDLGNVKMENLNETLWFFWHFKQNQGRLDGKGGLAAKTIDSLLYILKAAQRYAVMRGYLSMQYSIMPQCPKIERINNTVRVFDRCEQQSIERIALASGTSAGVGIYMSLYTGLRVGELSALRWQDVDFLGSLVTVRHTLQRIQNSEGDCKTKLVISPPKSKSSYRTLPMTQELKNLLQQHYEANPFNQRKDCFVFTSKDGHPIEPRLFQLHLKRMLENIGIEDVKFHALRHTFATRCLESHIDIKTLSELLGHSSVKISLDLYAHSMLEQKRRCINNLSVYMCQHLNDSRQILPSISI